MREIIFIGDGRDFHARDWYLTVKDVCFPREVFFVTDLIESEGCVRLVNDSDVIINLLNIDGLLYRNSARQ